MFRRRFKQLKSLQERLTDEAARLREEARTLPFAEREQAIRKARRIDAAAHMDQWLRSPGLQSPR